MATSKRPFPAEIGRYYRDVPEEERLTLGPSQLEFERTKEVIARYLPPPPGIVLDVGGAAGAYALWLAERGFRVHLVDVAPRLVQEAQRRSDASERGICACQIGDARDLAFGDAVADVVLLLGPLYHLTESGDRINALREVHRVLRRGGLLFAAAVSRYASALDGLARDRLADPAFGKIVERDLANGQHRNDTDQAGYWTTAYFHRPEDLRSEVTSVRFECEAVIGLEGPGWILSDFDERWAAARRREDLLRVARAIEREPSIVGMSAHLLAVAVKK